MNSIQNYIPLLKLYEESGIDETYNDIPFIFTATKPSSIIQNINNENINYQNKIKSILDIKDKLNNLIKNINNITELTKIIKEFNEHPLAKFTSNTITGIGVTNPSLIVIVETPNETEDRIGIFLTGETGELLKKILSAINCSIETNTYVFPISPFRAPGNRNLTKEELDILIPFAEKYISILKPKLILTFGSQSSNWLLNTNDSITNIRGKFYKYNDIEILPTFSLNYLLNNKEAKKKTWEDLQLLIPKLT